MKIDESSIEHVVSRLTEDAVIEWTESGGGEKAANDEMEYLRGVLDMAGMMKEVLKA